MEALNKKQSQSAGFVLDVYEQISPYIVSDCSANTLSNLVSRFSSYTMGEIVSPKGENVMGEEFMEFYVDEDALNELVLKLFYTEK